MRILRALFLTVIAMIFLTGCWDQNVYESIGFTQVMGIDAGENGKIKYTGLYPVVSSNSGGGSGQDGSSGSEEAKSEIGIVESELGREAREQEKMSSPLTIMGGKLQSILFNKEIAMKRNISNFLELYERDAQSTVQANVVIVDGNSGELIVKASKFKGKPSIANYLNDLLERNFKSGYCPSVNIIEYDITNNTTGISPIVPMIKLGDDKITITGTALINKDKMTGQLDTYETACLFLAMGKAKDSGIMFDLPEDIRGEKTKGLVFVIKVKSKSKLQLQEGVPSVTFDIKLDVNMREYLWGNITDPEYAKKLENSLNDNIMTCLDITFKKLQDARCDPFGLGAKVKAYHNGFWMSIGQLDGWEKLYSEMKATFNVNSRIVRFGEVQ